jgi:NhaA family Na+:H+ antiporter
MARRHEDRPLPHAPIQVITEPLSRFLHVEAASGVVLLLCAAVALIAANSAWSESYLAFWKTPLGFSIGDFSVVHSLKHWINDGLMALFFFVIGLEVKRELVLGELRDLRRAALPVSAALGGMIVPAAIYLLLQGGEAGARGWGIPMATDIAFVVGCLAILGDRVPKILRVVLLSLAIVDDIGAILVIAVGYTESLDVTMLLLGFLGLAIIFVLGRSGVRSFGVYVVLGTLVWFAFHESGVHATIAGVLLGLLTPARSYVSEGALADVLERAREVLHGGDWQVLPHRSDAVRSFTHTAREVISPVEYLEGALHPWSSFVIMPIFALANAGIPIEASALADTTAIAVTMGLVLGKPLGILLASWLVVKLVLKELPQGLTWKALAGGSCLAGIGFTMALFIAELALEGDELSAAKIGVLVASAIAAVLGLGLLSRLPAVED